MTTANDLFTAIRRWAYARNIVDGGPAQAQLCKLVEEVGELASALNKGRGSDAIDAVGDCLVVLTILAEQIGSRAEECLAVAYEQIKDRRGRMQDGIFIREDAE